MSKSSENSIATQVMAESFKILEKWQELPQLDLHLKSMRTVVSPEISKKVFALCRAYFRHRASVDATILSYCSKKPKRRVFQVLRIAFFQIMHQSALPKEVVTDVAVSWAKTKLNRHEANFINGVLRNFDPSVKAKFSASAQLGLQDELYSHWIKEFGEEKTTELAKEISQIAPVTARLLNAEDQAPAEWRELPAQKFYAQEKFYEISNPGEFFAQEDRLAVYAQDPATMASLSLLDPKQGETIADLCAAPGGKSLYIAQKIGNKGLLHSCDLSPQRLKTLQENLSEFKNVQFHVQDATRPKLEPASLDALLLDVPCSNTGVIRRKPDVQWSFSGKKLKELVSLQGFILKGSAKLIKDSGRIIYSTCSIEHSENEGQVEKFLAENPEFTCEQQIRLFPSEDHDGAFAAVLVKKA